VRYLFRRDTVFATIGVFLVIAVLYYNPLNAYFFNPVEFSLADFSFNDLAFSRVHENFQKDDRIIVINIDTAGRKTIADLLLKVNADLPRVIGLDVLFGPRKDEYDGYLKRTMESLPRLVTSYTLGGDNRQRLPGTAGSAGYVNFIGHDLGVIRYYRPFTDDSGGIMKSFTSAIIEKDDSAIYKKLENRRHPVEWINYRRTSQGYYVISAADLLSNKVESHFLQDKIVLLGLVSDNPYNIEDKHFTPLNDKLVGRSIPDMSGVIIHANILSMILDHDYIHRSPVLLNLLVAVLITWFHIAFLLKYYIHKHIWFHLVVKTAELGIGALLLYFSIMALRTLNLSIDFTVTLVSIIIAVDVLYFYEAFTHWLFRKYGVSSIFNPIHH
jgi:CHASE2 domain-containing sensor protein